MRDMVIQMRKECYQAMGGRKLYKLIKSKLQEKGISIGRDKFFDFLRAYALLVPKTRNFVRTTNSNHNFRKFPNLVSAIVPQAPEQLWVCDITYISLNAKHAYLALVTDAYSKKIMGFKLSTNMKASLTIDALQMAIKNRKYQTRKLILHSDRGLQYCAPAYVEFAQNNNLALSITEQYDPYENALAERINRTLKYDFALNRTMPNKTLALKMTRNAVNIYNSKRPHESLAMATPDFIHANPGIKYKSYRKRKSVETLALDCW